MASENKEQTNQSGEMKAKLAARNRETKAVQAFNITEFNDAPYLRNTKERKPERVGSVRV